MRLRKLRGLQTQSMTQKVLFVAENSFNVMVKSLVMTFIEEFIVLVFILVLFEMRQWILYYTILAAFTWELSSDLTILFISFLDTVL